MGSTEPVDVQELLDRGGKSLIDLLEYCVFSMQFEVVFAFLAREYRNDPTLPGALALYDVFCKKDAPARLSLESLLPPRDLRLQSDLEPLRGLWERAAAPPAPRPAKHLFDFLVREAAQGPGDSLNSVARRYDPGTDPLSNLPGGTMTAGQRAFVENVWRPRVRPRLVAAGFRRIGNVG